MIAPRHSPTLESECNILGQSIVDKKTYTVDLMLLASQSKYFVLTPSAQYNVDDENLPFPAIRCGEPEDIMNGILERKCQVLYSISTSISIISTSTTLSTMSFLIALPWRSDHSTWYFQTFGCRISYACEPGYQLLGRTHRSRPLSFLCPRCHMFDYKIQIRYFFFPLDVPTLSSTILCKIPALENSQVKSSCSVSFQKRLPNTNMSDCQTNKIRDLSETSKLARNLWSRRKFIHDSDPPLHN